MTLDEEEEKLLVLCTDENRVVIRGTRTAAAEPNHRRISCLSLFAVLRKEGRIAAKQGRGASWAYAGPGWWPLH
jgi:hypothetical protein